jgi:ABC-2 type transport system permease protein
VRRAQLVAAIVGKDLRVFARDRFYVVITVLGLVLYAGVFWLLPAAADETYTLGVHLPGGEALLGQAPGEEGLELLPFASSAALREAVEQGDEVMGGLDFPEGFLAAAAAGQRTTVRVLLGGDAPEELRPALVAGVREIAFAVAGEDLPVTLPAAEEIILGPDRGPLPLREQLRPLLVFLVLLVEMFALASLVAAEIAQRTVSAVLVTPTRVADLLAAKGLLGTGLAFGQALLIALVTGTLLRAPLLLGVALLLGAVLVTGFGLLAGATGRDFVGIIFWSMLLMIPLAVPAFAVLFPGEPAAWVRALPSAGLVDVIVGAAAHGEGWAEASAQLAALAAWCAAVFAAGVVVLGRRVARG